MEKKLLYKVELPCIEDIEETYPEKIITIPSWERGRTLLVLVGAGEQSKIVQKDYTKQQAKELVSWLGTSVPGYFYEAVVQELINRDKF